VGHIRWGLDRISRILEDLGDPHLAFDSLHIAGTNGKGSVCAIAGAIAGAEKSVGLYTSPHLSSWVR
jgi:dihydrofolate synthase/folylpolyglutamate synthase